MQAAGRLHDLPSLEPSKRTPSKSATVEEEKLNDYLQSAELKMITEEGFSLDRAKISPHKLAQKERLISEVFDDEVEDQLSKRSLLS